MGDLEKNKYKFDLVNYWISNCDTKSSFILTFYGVVITIIFTSSIGEEMISKLNFSRAEKINCETFGNFIFFIITISFFISCAITFYQIYLTLIARIDDSVYKEKGLNSNSTIFFGSISTKTFEVFEKESNAEDDTLHNNDLCSQIYINSKIAQTKFKHYNKSLIWLLISFGIFIFFIILK